MLELAQVGKQLCKILLQILATVVVGSIARLDVKAVVGAKVFQVIVVGKLIGDLYIQQTRSFIGPSTRYVTDGVATATHDEHGDTERFQVIHAHGVTVEGQIEASNAITSERISTALKGDDFGAEALHDHRTYRLKDSLVGDVIDTVVQREVERVVLTKSATNILNVTSTREELSVLVEGQGHNTVGCVEGLFNSVSMMDIDIDVENALVYLEKFKNTQDNVVDVTESTRFSLFGVVKTTCPVDGNIGLASVDLGSTSNGTSSTDLAVLEESSKDRAIFAYIEASQLRRVCRHVVRIHVLHEVDIVISMELGHVACGGRHWALQSEK